MSVGRDTDQQFQVDKSKPLAIATTVVMNTGSNTKHSAPPIPAS